MLALAHTPSSRAPAGGVAIPSFWIASAGSARLAMTRHDSTQTHPAVVPPTRATISRPPDVQRSDRRCVHSAVFLGSNGGHHLASPKSAAIAFAAL